MLDAKEVKFINVVKSGYWLLFKPNPLSSIKSAIKKRLSLIVASSLCHELPYDTHSRVVINRAEFRVLPPVVLEKLKHADRQAVTHIRRQNCALKNS